MSGWTHLLPLGLMAEVRICVVRLGLDDFAAAQAGSANSNALALASNPSMHRTQVDVPAPLRHIVGVADAVSRLRLLAADITLLCH